MAKANVILLNSILWNLREVTKLADKIKKHCGDVDCISWRYPLRSCNQLEIFKLLQNNRNLDNYTYILELTYDRLLYLFNLMIKYLESSDSLEKFRPSRNVHRPKTLSLASVLHMIWDRIQAQTEYLNRVVLSESQKSENEPGNTTESLTATKSSSYTQSEVCTISSCSCCEMVQRFMTQLVLDLEKILEKENNCMAIAEERQVMREHLVEMNNWTAMSRWLSAITKDFESLLEKAETAMSNSRKLRHRLDSGDRRMKNKIEQHEEDTRKLEAKLKDSEVKLSEMKQKLDKLHEEKSALKNEILLKTTELTSVTSIFENKITELKKTHQKQIKEKKEKKLKKEKEREEEMKKKFDIESKKLEKMEIQNKSLEKTISQLKEDLETLHIKTAEDKNNLTERLKELENKVETLKEENISLNTILEEKQNTIKNYSMRLMEAFPELNGDSKPKYQASGNPEIDMENHMEANRLRIELLQEENEKLQRTLEKIKSLKG